MEGRSLFLSVDVYCFPNCERIACLNIQHHSGQWTEEWAEDLRLFLIWQRKGCLLTNLWHSKSYARKTVIEQLLQMEIVEGARQRHSTSWEKILYLRVCWESQSRNLKKKSLSWRVQGESRLAYCDCSLGMWALVPAFISLKLHKTKWVSSVLRLNLLCNWN